MDRKNGTISVKTFCIILLLLCRPVHAQKAELSGYVTDMPSTLYVNMPGQTEWYWENLIHNRLNFGWQMNDVWRIDAGMRNRLVAGSSYLVQPEEMSFDKGRIDASWNLFNTAGRIPSLLNVAVDRFYLTFEKERWKLQLGRQRINWGQTFVWNPNDIFNAYSFFDFDYPERPGADAFRGTFFNSETAYTEFAVALNHYGKATAALMHHNNIYNTDIQVLAGLIEETDIVVGGAMTSDFNGLNLRIEASVFQPYSSREDSAATVAVSVGTDYIFPNSLMLQAELLYNNTRQPGNMMSLLNASELSAKRLSVSEWNLFAQASCPVSPRLNAAMSAMYFINIKGLYSGISIDYSLLENLDISGIIQYFTTTSGHSEMSACLGFIRLKYVF
ncbi:MAG: hypothetical protein LBR06_02635 [Bacteroidales bacterium]|nr:hypothetical protein [Bacteroidales bacterium]